ncbi:hypothetical protein SAY86_015606 [Trapa natans]|uniref:Uncharacterized protein n=1 Tax=Trapa natans TaxID=22666 RepID=A0AAN7QVN0_TRANT|nr:hypothetical protein SAY86_015606 [Trapa natans]
MSLLIPEGPITDGKIPVGVAVEGELMVVGLAGVVGVVVIGVVVIGVEAVGVAVIGVEAVGVLRMTMDKKPIRTNKQGAGEIDPSKRKSMSMGKLSKDKGVPSPHLGKSIRMHQC